MTPELPRAPRSRADAVVLDASAMLSGWVRLSSVTAVWIVRLMFVPVSPSGTGNTFRSLMACFCWVIQAAPKTIICLKTPPLIRCVMVRFLLLCGALRQ